MYKPYRILIGGDLFPSPNNVDLFISGNYEKLFDEQIINLFQQADFSVCNLEGVLTDSDRPIKKVDPLIKAPKEAWNGFQRLKLSAVTLANNHILDYGKTGFEDTIEVLNCNHIDWFGAGYEENIKKTISLIARDKRIVVYTVSETMFNCFQGDNPRVNLYDEYEVCRELAQIKQECDYLIVIYHGGTEFYWYGSELLRKRFHRMADCGADFIVAQHTHCIGLHEEYNGKNIFYGQGDFLFARRVNPYREYGLLLEIQVDDSLEVKRHLLKHVDKKVTLDVQQDFSEFDKRSNAFLAGENFDIEYSLFSDKKLDMFLEAFRGRNIQDRIAKKLLSKEKYSRYLRSRYTERQLLRIISGVQFEEYRESVIRGLWNSIHQ